MNRIRKLLITLGVLAFVWAYMTVLAPPRDAPKGPAPDIGIRTGSGVARLSALKGKVVLLDFWATWCGPCRTSIPAIERLYDRYRPRGFEVLGVSLDTSEEPVRRFTREMHMDYPSGLPVSDAEVGPYRPNSIPTMILVDKLGRIRRREEGYSQKTEEELAASIERLLKE